MKMTSWKKKTTVILHIQSCQREFSGDWSRQAEGDGRARALVVCYGKAVLGQGRGAQQRRRGAIQGSQGPHAASISSFSARLLTGCALPLGDWKKPILMAPVLAPESGLSR